MIAIRERLGDLALGNWYALLSAWAWVYLSWRFLYGSSLVVDLALGFVVAGSLLALFKPGTFLCYLFAALVIAGAGLLQILAYFEGDTDFLSGPRLLALLACGLSLWLIFGGPAARSDSSSVAQRRISWLVAAVCMLAIGLMNAQTLFVAEWTVLLLELMFIVVCALTQPDFFRRHKSFWTLFGVLTLLLLISNHLAARVDGAYARFDRVWHVLGHIAFAFAFYLWCLREKRVIELIVVVSGIALTIYTVLLLSAWFGQDAPYYHDWIHGVPLFGHIRHLGFYLCFLGVVAAFFVVHSTRELLPVSVLLCTLALTLLLWSGGRGAFIGVVLATMVTLWASQGRRRALWLLGCLAAALVISFVFRVEHPYLGWLSAVLRTERADAADALTSGRWAIWLQMLEPMRERLWFGWGGDGFRTVWQGRAGIIQPHNGIVQLQIEWGLIATIVLLGWIAWLYIDGWRQAIRTLRGSSPLQPGLVLGLSGATAYLFFSMTDGIFYYGLPGAYLAAFMGMLAAGVRCATYSGEVK